MDRMPSAVISHSLSLSLLTVLPISMSIIFFFLSVLTVPLKAEMRILPTGVGPRESIYVVNEGDRLELDCRLDKGDFTDTEDVDGLDWMRGQLRIGHNWLSMFTRPRVDEHRQWIGRTLVMPRVNLTNADQYKCMFFEDQQRTIRVHVLKAIQWRAPSDTPGGPIGEPLSIDCGANGVPEEAIQILDNRGRAMDQPTGAGEEDQQKIYVAGSELTIARLGRQHQGMKIRCLALRQVALEQLGAQGNTVHTDERRLTVDVWLPPKFEQPVHSSSPLSSALPHYAVPGSSQILRWTILESNPPPRQWTLSKDGRPIQLLDGERQKQRLRLERLEGNQNMFVLSIDDVQEDDYGLYKLTVHNGKLEAEQTLALVVTQPPSQPRVSAERVSSNGSVTLRLEEHGSRGQLPVAYFWISYRPVRRVPRPSKNATTTPVGGQAAHQRPIGLAQADQRSTVAPLGPDSTSQPYRLRRRKNPANLYDVAGLEPYTEYEFTIVAGNQAGESDPLSVKVQTVDRPDSAASPASSGAPALTIAHPPLFAILSILALVCLSRL